MQLIMGVTSFCINPVSARRIENLVDWIPLENSKSVEWDTGHAYRGIS